MWTNQTVSKMGVVLHHKWSETVAQKLKGDVRNHSVQTETEIEFMAM